jgi:uncharacterized protein
MPLVLTLSALQLASAQTATQPASGAEAKSTRLQVIDVHTHTRFSGGKESTSQIAETREQYFREWEEAGVVGAVAHTKEDGSDYHQLKANNVIHCAGAGTEVDKKRIEAGLKSGQFGCLKLYLGYAYRYATDKKYRPLYKLAEKYDVPVVFHTGDTYSRKGKLKYADPLTIDEVAVDFPNVRFVIAHCGYPWIESAAEVAYKNPNVFLECSALLIGDFGQMTKEKIDQYMVRPIAWAFGYLENPKKMLFGSDWPLVGIKPYLEAYKRAIPPEYWNEVFYENAVRVFKLTRVAPGTP